MAWLGRARPGRAWLGQARLHTRRIPRSAPKRGLVKKCVPGDTPNKRFRGVARIGVARRGAARLHTLPIGNGGQQWGMARLGAAWRGVARRGSAWPGGAGLG